MNKTKNYLIKKYDNLIGDLMLKPNNQIELLETFRDWLLNYLEETELE